MRGSSRCKRARWPVASAWLSSRAFVPATVARFGEAGSAAIDLRLIQAVKNRDIAAVRALLKQRVDVNAAQGDGATALHWAAHRDDLAIADLLIRSGARANVANDLGRDAAAPRLHQPQRADGRAAAGGRRQRRTRRCSTARRCLMTCARAGDAAAVKALLARGADVNAKEREHQQTALMWAAAAASSRRRPAAHRGRRRHSRALARPTRRPSSASRRSARDARS